MDLGDTQGFSEYEPEISCCIIRFWLDTNVDVGNYGFTVTLSDGVAKNTY